MIRRLLIANRGEIALRIIRSAHGLGIATVAVYSEADRDAPHVRAATIALPIGPAQARESYLNIERILATARSAGADAIHPGYGFLAENAEFARACAAAGLTFVGPSAIAIEAMADKALAKQRVREAGVACLPGFDDQGANPGELRDAALALGLPLMIKARAGGGGRGMRLVTRESDLIAALASAEAEAQASFGDGRLLIERALVAPRHIEVQIFADDHGHLVHMGERECSIQRRHQKLIEESPSPAVGAQLRSRLTEAALKVARCVDYCGAGTIEFLLEGDGSEQFYFMEMNTRLQVEHAVTELVTGLDLVALQLRVAGGESLAAILPRLQEDISLSGHAIEARLCAEDPVHEFLPMAGTLLAWKPASGARVDHALDAGRVVDSWYDSLLAKLVVHAPNRELARLGLAAALDETVALGIVNNRAFLCEILRTRAFEQAQTSTAFLAEHEGLLTTCTSLIPDAHWAIAAAVLASDAHDHPIDDPWFGWSSSGLRTRPVRLQSAGQERELLVESRNGEHLVRLDGPHAPGIRVALAPPAARVEVDGQSAALTVVSAGNGIYLQFEGRDFYFRDCSWSARSDNAGLSEEPLHSASMTGRVASVSVKMGQTVASGEVLLVLEAMKMEHPLTARIGGRITEVLAEAGAQVSLGQALVRIEPLA